MSTSENPQVFLSYAHDDLAKVRKLYSDLKARNVNVWFDKESMSPGKWKTQIQKAIPKSNYFLFCISQTALRKTQEGSGFVDDELQQAYKIAMEQDERLFTIVPVRLEKEVSHGDHRLSIFQQYDLFEDWEAEIDKLAVYLGGEARSSLIEKEERSEEEQLIEGLMGKAVVSYYTKEYEKALRFYEIIIDMNPSNSYAWYGKGVALDYLGQHEEALTAYEKTLELNPDDAGAWNNRGVALNNLGRHEEALAAYEKALELNPDFEAAWNNKGSSAEQPGPA